MNHWTATGHLTKDPKLLETDNGTAICTLRLAVNSSVPRASTMPAAVGRPWSQTAPGAARDNVVELALVSGADGHGPLVDQFVAIALDANGGGADAPPRPTGA